MLVVDETREQFQRFFFSSFPGDLTPCVLGFPGKSTGFPEITQLAGEGISRLPFLRHGERNRRQRNPGGRQQDRVLHGNSKTLATYKI